MQMGKVWKYAGSGSASLETISQLSCFLPKANWQMFKLNNHFLACDFPPVFFETVLWRLLTVWAVFSWFSTVLGLPADPSAKKILVSALLMIITRLWIFEPISPQRQRHLLTFWAFQFPFQPDDNNCDRVQDYQQSLDLWTDLSTKMTPREELAGTETQRLMSDCN